jgi:hypothetical protein
VSCVPEMRNGCSLDHSYCTGRSTAAFACGNALDSRMRRTKSSSHQFLLCVSSFWNQTTCTKFSANTIPWKCSINSSLVRDTGSLRRSWNAWERMFVTARSSVSSSIGGRHEKYPYVAPARTCARLRRPGQTAAWTAATKNPAS